MFRKVILAIIPMLLFSSFASAKLSESEMCKKLKAFYMEYAELLNSYGQFGGERWKEIVRKNCTPKFAELNIEDVMGLDYILNEYDSVDVASIDVTYSDDCYKVSFYSNCCQADGSRPKLKITLCVMVEDDLISDVEDRNPKQRYVKK